MSDITNIQQLIKRYKTTHSKRKATPSKETERLPLLNMNDPLEKALYGWKQAIIWRDSKREEFEKRAEQNYKRYS